MPQTLLASEKALNHEDGINLTNGLAEIKNAIYGIGDNGNLAAIEVSPAESAHAVGAYLTYHGILYEVTAAIAVGDSLAEGTNIVKKTVDERFNEIEDFIDAKFDDDWTYIANQVAHGNGARLYPVASQFIIPHTEYGNMVFDVLHHITPASDAMLKAKLPAGKQYGMVIGMHDVIYSTQFDREEAFYYAENGLTAGTYNITVKAQPWYTADENKTFQFTLASDVPAGGILCWGDYNASREGKYMTAYASRSATSAQQTATMTEGSGGTSLGATDGNSAHVNHFHRTMFGSNDWEESGVRQWLNTDAAANNWWEPKTEWDRIISYSNRNGFLKGFSADFVGALLNCTHKNRSNSVYDSHGTSQAYYTTDKMFLLCNEECGLAQEQSIECGKLFDYYLNATNTDRIKYDITNSATARYWWLRSPNPSHSGHERGVHTSGALDSYYASSGLGVAAACIIG